MSHDALTDDLWRCIGLKLDAGDRIRFRAVSKSWMSLVPPPLWLMLGEQQEPTTDSDGHDSSGESEPEHGDDDWLMLAEQEEPPIDGDDSSDESEPEHGDDDGTQQHQPPIHYGDSSDESEPEHGDDDGSQQHHQHRDQVGDEQEKAASVTAVAAPPPPPRGFATIGEHQQTVYIDYPPLHGAHPLGSTGNWLITAHRDTSIRLINPFAKQQFHLPPLTTFDYPVLDFDATDSDIISKEDFMSKNLWKFVLSSPPSKGHDCVAVAIHGIRMILAIARVGDAKWTTLQIGDELHPRAVDVQDVIFYREKFYACSSFGLFVCNIEDDPPRITRVYNFPQTDSRWYGNYLVEWLGELLWVNKRVDNHGRKFEVHRYDFVEKKMVEVKSLGDHSLFLGFNTSIALKASDYGGLFRKNCIYFTDDVELRSCEVRIRRIPAGDDMGVYDLGDKNITPHFRGVLTSLYSPPLWVIPFS